MDQIAPQAPQQTAPTQSEWPGAFKLYNAAKTATMVNWQTYLIIMLISFAVSAVANNIGGQDVQQPKYYVAQFLSIVFSIFLTTATTLVALKSVSHEKISVSESFSQGSPRFTPMLFATLLSGILTFLSGLLFLIPLFFVMPRLAFTSYYVMDKKLGPIDAVKASWESSRGHAGKVWGIIGVTFLFALIMITIIGIPVSLYLIFMYSTAPALLYRWVVGTTPQAPAAPTPVVPAPPTAPQQ